MRSLGLGPNTRAGKFVSHRQQQQRNYARLQHGCIWVASFKERLFEFIGVLKPRRLPGIRRTLCVRRRVPFIKEGKILFYSRAKAAFILLQRCDETNVRPCVLLIFRVFCIFFNVDFICYKLRWVFRTPAHQNFRVIHLKHIATHSRPLDSPGDDARTVEKLGSLNTKIVYFISATIQSFKWYSKGTVLCLSHLTHTHTSCICKRYLSSRT